MRVLLLLTMVLGGAPAVGMPLGAPSCGASLLRTQIAAIRSESPETRLVFFRKLTEHSEYYLQIFAESPEALLDFMWLALLPSSPSYERELYRLLSQLQMPILNSLRNNLLSAYLPPSALIPVTTALLQPFQNLNPLQRDQLRTLYLTNLVIETPSLAKRLRQLAHVQSHLLPQEKVALLRNLAQTHNEIHHLDFKFSDSTPVSQDGDHLLCSPDHQHILVLSADGKVYAGTYVGDKESFVPDAWRTTLNGLYEVQE